MVLSINAVWRNAFARAEVEPVYLIRVHVGAGSVEGDDVFTFASKSGYGYPASVSDVSPIGAAIDVFTRRFTGGEQSITFRDDGALRQLISEDRLRGRLVDVLLGAVGMTEASFVQIAKMGIVDWSQREGEIAVRCADAYSILRSREVTGSWTNYHPLELIEYLLQAAGVPAALYDATTLDPSNYTDSISHFNISRLNLQVPYVNLDTGLNGSLRNSLEMVNELAEILSGSFLPNESGIFGFQLYSPNAGIQRTLYGTPDAHGATDIGNLEQSESVRNLCNEFSVLFGHTQSTPLGGPNYVFTRRDAASIAAHEVPGSTEGIFSQALDSSWLNGIAFQRSTVGIPLGATSFVVDYAGLAGISGCHYDSTPSRPSWAEPSPTRPVYLRIEGAAEGGLTEVISVVDIQRTGPASIAGGVDTAMKAFDDAHNPYPMYLEFFIGDRGLLGTTPVGWLPGAIHNIVDLTIPIAMAATRVPRFSNGVEILSFTTSMRHFDLQVGDFVAIVDDQPIGYGLDGSSLAETWELVRKEVQPLDDSPRIQWLAARVITDESGVVDEYDNPAAVFVGPRVDFNVILLDGTDVIMGDGQLIYIH